MIESLNQLMQKIEQLPKSEQERIIKIISQEIEYNSSINLSKEIKDNSSFSLENQPFLGMWKNRTDMQNSSEWVRQLRQKQWNH